MGIIRSTVTVRSAFILEALLLSAVSAFYSSLHVYVFRHAPFWGLWRFSVFIAAVLVA
jgi:hypothetical protein